MVSIFAAIIQLPQFAQARAEGSPRAVMGRDPHGVAACRSYGGRVV